jgi:hypothetical protein
MSKLWNYLKAQHGPLLKSLNRSPAHVKLWMQHHLADGWEQQGKGKKSIKDLPLERQEWEFWKQGIDLAHLRHLHQQKDEPLPTVIRLHEVSPQEASTTRSLFLPYFKLAELPPIPATKRSVADLVRITNTGGSVWNFSKHERDQLVQEIAAQARKSLDPRALDALKRLTTQYDEARKNLREADNNVSPPSSGQLILGTSVLLEERQPHCCDDKR